MTKRILSWDVGIKNLAYCLIEITTIDNKDTFKIKKWDSINLAESRYVCCFSKKNNELCGAIASHSLKLDDERNYYYCKAHMSKASFEDDVKDVNIEWNILPKVDKCDRCKTVKMVDVFKCNSCEGQYCKTHVKTLSIEGNYRCDAKKCDKMMTKKINNIGWCDDHYEEGYQTHLEKKMKKISQSCMKISLDKLTVTMFQKLDELADDFLQVDEIYIENQPSFINPTMKSISCILYSYFCMRGLYEKAKNSTIKGIHLCAPSNKIKIGGDDFDKKLKEIDVDKSKVEYKLTKSLGVRYCKALIADDASALAMIDSHKKKDDLADSFLQGFYKTFNPVPEHYFNMLKEILGEQITKPVKGKKIKKTKDIDNIDNIYSNDENVIIQIGKADTKLLNKPKRNIGFKPKAKPKSTV